MLFKFNFVFKNINIILKGLKLSHKVNLVLKDLLCTNRCAVNIIHLVFILFTLYYRVSHKSVNKLIYIYETIHNKKANLKPLLASTDMAHPIL